MENIMGIGVGVILLNDEGKVLLLLRNNDEKLADSNMHYEGQYTLPAGKVKFGETLEQAAKRKTKAETNLDVNIEDINVVCMLNDHNEYAHYLTVGTIAKNYSGIIDLGKTQGLLPKTEIIPGEKIKMGSNIKAYINKVSINSKGALILLTRKHFGFVKRLFELEIPEINDGTVMIYSVARDPGNRSKVAVYSENPNVDPIGACIGEKGSRIARIIEELHGEKLDIVKYDSDPAVFIENALSPAKELTVAITDPKKLEAMVIADGDNFSLAIGKKGQNARLATRLTKFRKIDIKTTEQAREAGINFR